MEQRAPKTADLEAARRYHLALRQIFIRHTGQVADRRALRRALALCNAIDATAGDAYCREKLRVVKEYAAEMLGHTDHAKWGRERLTGTEFLRQQVLNALELLASRLYSLEALQRANARIGAPQWTTLSSIARI
jgi:hypothetical protein